MQQQSNTQETLRRTVTKTVCTEAKPVEVVFEESADVTGKVQLGSGNRIEIQRGGTFQGGLEVGTGAEVRISGKVCAGREASRRCAQIDGREFNSTGGGSTDSDEDDKGIRVDGKVIVDGDAEVKGTMELSDDGKIEINEGSTLRLSPPGRFASARKGPTDLLRRSRDANSTTDAAGNEDDNRLSSGSLVLKRGSRLEISDDDDSEDAGQGTTGGAAGGEPRPRSRRNATELRLAVGSIQSEGRVEIKGRKVRLEAGAVELKGKEGKLEVSGASRLELDAPVIGTGGAGVVVREGGRMVSRPLWSSASGLTASADVALRKRPGRTKYSNVKLSGRAAGAAGDDDDDNDGISTGASAALSAGNIFIGRAMSREVSRIHSRFASSDDNTTQVGISTSGELVDLSGSGAWRPTIERYLENSMTFKNDPEYRVYASTFQDRSWGWGRVAGDSMAQPYDCGGNWARTNSTL